MQKIQVQAEIDIQNFLSQLRTTELEEFLREAAAMLTRRKVSDKKTKEAELLHRLNEECALPDAHWHRFNFLQKKQSENGLAPEETVELFQLIKEEEQLRLKRIQILGEMAQLKGISLLEMANKLGIKEPEHAR